jgi:thiol-disulfide isomerase/thioredoxin
MRTLLYFGGSTCPPCKHFWKTIIKPQIADVYPNQVDFVVDDYNTAMRYHIKYTPTLILLDEDGNEVKRYVGCSEAMVGEIIDFLENGKK